MYDDKQKNSALSLHISFSKKTIPPHPRSSEKREEGCDYSLRSHVLRVEVSISGLGSNFSSLRRIITESFPRQAASSATNACRCHFCLLGAFTDTRAPFCGNVNEKCGAKNLLAWLTVLHPTPPPPPRPSFLWQSSERYIDCLGFRSATVFVPEIAIAT